MESSISLPEDKIHYLNSIKNHIFEKTGQDISINKLMGIIIDISSNNVDIIISEINKQKISNSDFQSIDDILEEHWQDTDIKLRNSNKTDDEIVYG